MDDKIGLGLCKTESALCASESGDDEEQEEIMNFECYEVATKWSSD